MQPEGTYQLIEALGSCQVGTVWSAVDNLGRSVTVAVLDPAAAADHRWREAFASTTNALLNGEASGPTVLFADLSASAPWAACAAGDGPGAEQIFIALGMEYFPAPFSSGADSFPAAAAADGFASPDLPAPPDQSGLQSPTVGLPAVSPPPIPAPADPGPVSAAPSPSSAPPAPVSGAPQPVSGAPQSPVAVPRPPTFEPLPPVSDAPQWTGWSTQQMGEPTEVSYTYDQGFPPLKATNFDAPRRRTGLWVAVAVAVVVALAAGGGIYALQAGGGEPVGSASPTPKPTLGYNRRFAGNTGVPRGTNLTVVKGDQTFDEDKKVYSDLDIHGDVRITGDNIILRRSIVRGVGKMKGDKCTTIPVIWVDGGSNVTIEDVEVYGADANACLDGIWAKDTKLNRVDIHGVVDGVKAFDNVIIQYSYIHDLARFASDPTHDGGPTHNDGVQSWEGNHDITLRRNTIKISERDNAAFQVNQSKGTPATDIHVEENFIDGGWCTLNFSEGDGPTPMTGVFIANNHFGRTSSCTINLSAGVRLSANDGNIWDDTGEPIPAPRQSSK